jgi:hypothetical protein
LIECKENQVARRKGSRLKLYRYQILPLTQDLQPDFVRGISSLEDLRQNKNRFFAEAVRGIKEFHYRKMQIVHRIDESEKDSWFLLRIGSRHYMPIDTKDFQQKKVENWPHLVVVVNNSSKVQKIAIAENRKAFSSSKVVINAIRESLNEVLKRSQLSIEIEPLFEQHVFWDLIDRYRGKVVQVAFDLISPNMANISGGLKLDLAALQQDTNTHRTKLELNSDQNASLELDPRSEVVNSIVKYSSEGAGDISVRIRGLKKKISTRTETREVFVEDITIENLRLADLTRIQDLLE